MAVNADPDFVDDGAPVSDVDDDEFIDDGAESRETGGSNDDQIGGRQPKKVRGPDLEWIEVKTFSTTNDFKNSEIKKDIDANYSRRKFDLPKKNVRPLQVASKNGSPPPLTCFKK